MMPEPGKFDANDIHVAFGLDAVREQLQAALAATKGSSPVPSAGEPERSMPTPPNDDQYETRFGLAEALERFALAMPDGKVCDTRDRKLIKPTAAKALFGATLYKEWLEYDQRRSIDPSLVAPIARAAAETPPRAWRRRVAQPHLVAECARPCPYSFRLEHISQSAKLIVSHDGNLLWFRLEHISQSAKLPRATHRANVEFRLEHISQSAKLNLMDFEGDI